MDNKVDPKIYEAFQLIKKKDYPKAQQVLEEGLRQVEGTADKQAQAVFVSTLGVLCKVQGRDREAWRYYETAEKLLPDDPSLKLISAKFLIERFAQYDAAIKKLRKVLKIARGSPSFEHQARALMALACLRKGEKKRARELLVEAMAGDFQSLISASNINLDLIEGFLARNLEPELCRTYLEKGLKLAEIRREEKVRELFSRLLESMTHPPLKKGGGGDFTEPATT